MLLDRLEVLLNLNGRLDKANEGAKSIIAVELFFPANVGIDENEKIHPSLFLLASSLEHLD